jgi:DNA-binding MarR family transcriptional regulator
MQKKQIKKVHIHQIFENNLTYLFTKTAATLKREFVELLQEDDILPPHKGILTLLEKSNDYNQLLIGKELNLNKVTIVRLLDVLESKKFIARISSSTDRRENFVRITPMGLKYLKITRKKSLVIEDQFFKALSENEKKILMSLLLKINDYKPSTNKNAEEVHCD